jgi:hypothetical protein
MAAHSFVHHQECKQIVLHPFFSLSVPLSPALGFVFFSARFFYKLWSSSTPPSPTLPTDSSTVLPRARGKGNADHNTSSKNCACDW